MTRHRHEFRALVPDYVRAAAGILLTAGPAALVPTTAAVFWILTIFAVLFACYAVTVFIRQASILECTDDGIALSGPIRKSILWTELREARLKYFSTRRDGAQGWMQLVIKGSGVSIRIESTLNGFADIVKRSVKAANDEGLTLSSSTLRNLELMGVSPKVVTSASGSP